MKDVKGKDLDKEVGESEKGQGEIKKDVRHMGKYEYKA